MALANPYTFKLDVATFLADQAACMEDQFQGKVIINLTAHNLHQKSQV